LEVKIAEERGKAQKAKAACRAYEYCALDYKEFDEGIMKKTIRRDMQGKIVLESVNQDAVISMRCLSKSDCHVLEFLTSVPGRKQAETPLSSV